MSIPSLLDAAMPPDQLAELRGSDAAVYWLARSSEDGAFYLWRSTAEQSSQPYCISPTAVGSQVNQYGGGSHAPMGNRALWVRQHDQALCESHDENLGLTVWWASQDAALGGLCADPQRQRVLAVEETSTGTEITQRLVAFRHNERIVLAEGADFYGGPTLSPNGALLAWVEWSLPSMPWQRSWLCIANVEADGALSHTTTRDFGAAVGQPVFTPGNELIVMSDHAGWWQPWRVTPKTSHCLSREPFDHITTPWQLSECQHAWGEQDHLLVRLQQGASRLYRVTDSAETLCLPDTTRITGIARRPHGYYVLAQGPNTTTQLIKLSDPDSPEQVIAGASPIEGAPRPQSLKVPIDNTRPHSKCVHGFFYPAHLSDPSETTHSTPMIMRVHGGPTSASYPTYDPLIHYWTTQGFSVVDINPRGSGNYGRAYRQSLEGQWGVFDTQDVERVVDHLITQERIDPNRCFIRGQSAGGFTVLNALANSTRFLAGTSFYGVTDAISLARQTHHFESGYLGWLMGDHKQQRLRSPLYRLTRCSHTVNVLLVQGALDQIVVPAQTHHLAKQLRNNGGQAEVLIFDNESHGMRSPANRMAMIDREHALSQPATVTSYGSIRCERPSLSYGANRWCPGAFSCNESDASGACDHRHWCRLSGRTRRTTRLGTSA